MANERIKSGLTLAAYVTAVSLVLTYILEKFLGMSVTQLFSIGSPASALTSTVGTKFLAFINNFVAFDITSIVILYISIAIIVIVGAWLMDLGLPKGKSAWQRLALILLYGTVPFYLLLVGFKVMSIANLVGMLIWYAAIALSVGIVQKYIKI